MPRPMTGLRTILVDDEPRGINSLQKLLQLNCPEVSVIGSCSNVDMAIEKINELRSDLVFLDIGMPVKNGFDLLKELKQTPFEVIFVTAHNQFMIEAFHFSAIDYLLKLVDDDLLVDAVKRAKTRIAEKTGSKNIETFLHNVQIKQGPQNMKLCIPSLKGFQVVELHDILYAEASGNYTNFHFTNRSLICASKPIHEYEELLSDCNFVRIHKSFLVNLGHIKEYIRGEGGSVILSNGNEIEVSRRKKDMLLSKMKTFYKF
ncbi:MAG: LytTR family DNA-binding domain-containing protein [Bacteroidota bacterium]|nr:LytTR family DNA-binding domain-containing protein [Bacteroidota bacterium]